MLGAAGSYWELPGAAGSCWEALCAIRSCWQLLTAAGSCGELLGAAGSCWELLGSAKSYPFHELSKNMHRFHADEKLNFTKRPPTPTKNAQFSQSNEKPDGKR